MLLKQMQIYFNADIFNCVNALGYLSANLAHGMREPKSRASIIALFNNLISEDIQKTC